MSVNTNTAVMETDERMVLAPTGEVARNEVGTELDDTKKEIVTNVKKFTEVMKPNVKAAGGRYKEDINKEAAEAAKEAEAAKKVVGREM